MKNAEPPFDFWKSLRRFFASIRLTIVVLLSLAASSIIGTLIPQNADPAAYIRKYGESLYRLFDILHFFDMYHSWWFQLLLLLLTVNIIVCSLERLKTVWKTVFVKAPKYNPARFEKQEKVFSFSVPRSAEALRGAFSPILARRYRNTRVQSSGEDYYLFGEKGRLTRLGVYAVHLSIVLLVCGGLVGSLAGFEGFVTIPEGETVDAVRLRRSGRMMPLGFSIRCDDFTIRFYENRPGMPEEYRSSLSILKQGEVVKQKEVIVNDPLRYQGINIYQSSYGKLPAAMQALPAGAEPESARLHITIRSTGMSYEAQVGIGEVVRLPEGQGTLTLQKFLPAADFGGQNIGPAFFGVLHRTGAEPVELMLPLQFPKFDRMRRGELVIAVADVQGDAYAAARESDVRYYTGLQITKDPGVWLVYIGFMVMVAGCFITFFTSHQRVCVALRAENGQTRVTVAGLANKNRIGMQMRMEKLARKLEKAGT